MRILIVTRGQHETDDLTSAVSKQGHRIEAAQTVEEALGVIESNAPDIVILDVKRYNLRDLRHLLGDIKYSGRPQFLGLIDEEDLVQYDPVLGLDDFVAEPYKPVELVTRLEQLRWRRGEGSGKELIKCGDLVVDLSKYEVRVAGKVVSLSLKEYELLCFLASNRGRVFSRKTLLNKVWSYDYIGGARTVDVHIRRLRSKIEDSVHSFIKTVRGAGYKFDESA